MSNPFNLPPGCLPRDIEGPQMSDEQELEIGDMKLDLQKGDVDL